MTIFKRILLFLAVNFLVVMTISLLLNFFNIRPFISHYGLEVKQLMLFCLIWGMVGACISLALSKVMAKWMMGVKIIDSKSTNPDHQKLFQIVEELSERAGLSSVPEIGVFDSPEVNAFATGPTKRHSLVAVSRGLLEKMGDNEIEGVVAHEIAHIANGDMVTMTLIQGIVNAFVMFLARILAYVVSGLGKDRRQSNSGGSYGSYMLLVFVFEIGFMILGSLVIAAFSRFREYRADRGGALLAGKEKMVGALQTLRALQMQKSAQKSSSYVGTPAPPMQALMISNAGKKNWLQLFATHPPLELRIERLTRTSDQ